METGHSLLCKIFTMNFVLLLGAGFTRNWGGWLASEVFEYLLGSPEIDDNLCRLLLHYKRERGWQGYCHLETAGVF